MKSLAALVLAAVFGLPVVAEEEKDAALKKQILGQLDTTTISLEFKDAPIDEVMQSVHTSTKLNFVLSPAVQEGSKRGEFRIDIRLKDVCTRVALRLMLENVDLALVYRRGVLIVETKEERDSEMRLEVFDVSELLVQIRNLPGPRLELQTEDQFGAVITGISIAEDESRFLDDPETLIDLIRNATGGDATWSIDGVALDISDGRLFVLHTEAVRREIQQLIVSLRQYK